MQRKTDVARTTLVLRWHVLIAFLLVTTCIRAQERTRHFELQAHSEKFWELLDKDAKLDRIATGFGFTEGPVWDPSGFLYVSDEIQNIIFRVYVNDGGRK